MNNEITTKEILYNIDRVKRHIPFEIWDTIRARLVEHDALKARAEKAEADLAQLQSACYDGCATGDSVFDELKWTTKERDTLKTALARFQPLIEAAGRLNAGDMAWFDWMMETTIAEYAPRVEGVTCPGRGRKDRFRALLAAIPKAAEKREEEKP